MLDWTLFNNPVLSDGQVYLPLSSRFEVSEASFGTTAVGGFADATLTLRDVPEAVLLDAVGSGTNNWLMKELRVHDAQGVRAYEGIVAEVSAQRGRHRYNRSLTNLYNRARVEYWQPDPLHAGKRRQGLLQLNDAPSQALYGIKEYRLDLTQEGTLTQAQATARGSEFLELSRLPQSFSLDMGVGDLDAETLGAETRNELQLKCWGYWATFKWRYTNFRVRTARDLSAIFYKPGNNLSLFTLYLNGYYAQFVNRSDFTQLANCQISIVYNSTGSLQTMQDYILALMKYGDANLRRANFQLWENRTPYLAVRSTAAQVYTRSDDGRVWSVNHTPLPAYLARAGGYVIAEDYQGSLDDYSGDVKSDPRAQFMDATTYNDLTGITQTTAPQEDNLSLILGRVLGKRRYVNV